jgi:processive 1,2-diacylglycerol beta-glucosyltransferase
LNPFRPTTRIAGPRVLFCTADVGCGHGRAALAVSDAMRTGWPGVQTKVVDALSTTPAWFNHLYRDLYLLGAKHFPRLNGWLYDRTDIPDTLNQDGFAAMVEFRATQVFSNSDPIRQADLIVCTHFLCARVLSKMRGRNELKAPLAVVVTDQHPHAVWRVPHADLFLVASETAAAEMARHGIPPGRVVVTGIPIDTRFAEPMARSTARARHDLPPDAPIILLSGGGLGLGGIDLALDGILSAGGDIFTIAVCGKNEKLHAQLKIEVGSDFHRCRILGITSRMHELMAAADLLVGKPGGLTTAEAAAIGLPMILLRPIPGQEERNAAMLVNSAAAQLHQNPFDAGRAAATLVNNSHDLNEMRQNALRFGRRCAAHSAAAAALSLCNTSNDRFTFSSAASPATRIPEEIAEINPTSY